MIRTPGIDADELSAAFCPQLGVGPMPLFRLISAHHPEAFAVEFYDVDAGGAIDAALRAQMIEADLWQEIGTCSLCASEGPIQVSGQFFVGRGRDTNPKPHSE